MTFVVYQRHVPVDIVLAECRELKHAIGFARLCIDRVLDLFAAYFDRHEYIGDAEYDRFTEILRKIREECE